jgi:O-antigen/teichoic acid export membrane protein
MSFIRSVAVLISGTAVGHGITAAALPVLSRLYSPADFSLLAVFAALVSILSVGACLRFDIAISLPSNKDEALRVFALAVMSAACFALVLCVLTPFASLTAARLTNQPKLGSYLWLVPIAVLMAAVYSALQAWFVREKSFSLIARSRVVQSASSTGAQIGLGVGGMTPFGLIFGSVLNAGSACIRLGIEFCKNNQFKQLMQLITLKEMRNTFRRYDQFPRYSTVEALCNSAALHVPLIMIAALAIGPEAGYLTLAMTAMQAPMSLFGTAVGQVYISYAANEHRVGNLGRFTVDTLGKLLWLGVGPILALGILAPRLFTWIFGQEWERAGWLVAWMTPWFVMQFLASPLSLGLHVAGKQKLALIFQVFGLVLRVLAIWLAYAIGQSLGEAYAIANFLFYALHLIIILKIVKVSSIEILETVSKPALIILAWLITAIGLNLFISYVAK